MKGKMLMGAFVLLIPVGAVSAAPRVMQLVENGDAAGLSAALRRPGNITSARDQIGRTPLIRAAELGRTEMVELLLSAGAAVGDTDNLGNSPLLRASAAGHLPVVKLLIERGAEIDRQNRRGETAALLAKTFGQEAVLATLLAHGARFGPRHWSYMTVSLYIAYLLISIALTVWVARTLHTNGRIFLVDAFRGNDKLADSVNHLLVVGFYLINIGYISFALKTGTGPENVQELIELLSRKVGIVLLILGGMHFFNIFMFGRLRKKTREQPRSAHDALAGSIQA